MKKKIFGGLVVLGILVSGAFIFWANSSSTHGPKCATCPCFIKGCCPPDQTDPDDDPV